MMRSDELRNLQAPLKDKYREQPESAIITLKADRKILCRLPDNSLCYRGENKN